jgi:hypothetical protein
VRPGKKKKNKKQTKKTPNPQKAETKQNKTKQKNPECRQDSFGEEGLAGNCNLTPWDRGSESQPGSSVNLLVT